MIYPQDGAIQRLNNQDLVSIHFLKELVERIWKRSKPFPVGDQFINSHDLFIWLFIDIVRRKLYLVTLATWRVKISPFPSPSHTRLRAVSLRAKRARHANDHARDWRLPRSRTRSLPSENLKKKRDCLQSIHTPASQIKLLYHLGGVKHLFVAYFCSPSQEV